MGKKQALNGFVKQMTDDTNCCGLLGGSVTTGSVSGEQSGAGPRQETASDKLNHTISPPFPLLTSAIVFTNLPQRLRFMKEGNWEESLRAHKKWHLAFIDMPHMKVDTSVITFP